MPAWLVNLAYLVASVMFIYGLKFMTHPRTARRGNLISAVGMLLAIVFTLQWVTGIGWAIILAGFIVGSAIGAVWAYWVPMTAMPQMVAIFNGFGGLASFFVAWAELIENRDAAGLQELIAIAAAGLIGAVTFWGSFVAFAKLQEIRIFKKPWVYPGLRALNALMTLICIGLGVWIVLQPSQGPWVYLFLVIVASVLGVTLVNPIGGADMPVVICLLNSYSGMAGCATGFVLNNNMLIIAGSLVGASGIILTAIMCKAMNRSLANVVFGRIDASKSASADDIYEGKIKSVTAEELAMMLDGVQRVVIVPGYGMAVAQAQHAVRDLYNLLESKGVAVDFAIHPVAGRMPGHMNVLLAEVSIPYEKMVEMDAINPQMEQVDVCIVLGANDVVNPIAREPDSAIAGMPIIDVDKARTVVVIKRSLASGFAGIPNPLFANDNTLMYFGDGKKTIVDLVAAIKEND
jgi:proton-translocating NAD(P)+ transhydrogenase subunit beta